jgi:alkylmercury lyase
MLEAMDRTGHARRDDAGNLVGSAGLNVLPDRHEIQLGGRRYWTWCAYDVLGIFGSLGASGRAASRSPLTGGSIEVRFHDGRPQQTSVVLFLPEDSPSCCGNVYEEWCPNLNFFEDEAAATKWSSNSDLSGRVLGLDEGVALAAAEWQALSHGIVL